MGFRRTGYGDKYKALGYSEYVCDTEDDISTLPTSSAEGTSNGAVYPKCSAGSIASVVDSHKVYILNTQDEWCEFIDYDASGGSGDGGGDDGGGSDVDPTDGIDLNNVNVFVADYVTEPPTIISGGLNSLYGYINGQ